MPPPVVVHGLVAQLEENGGLPEAPNFPPPPRGPQRSSRLGDGQRASGRWWLMAECHAAAYGCKLRAKCR
ncbi:MAG: hypothetical protein RLZZ158_480 [Cyanobacteriota bacterium]